MQYAIYSASEWLYPEGNGAGQKEVRLYAARRGYVGFQVLLSDLMDGAQIAIDRPFGGALSLEAYRLRDVMVERNTGRKGFVWTEEGAPEYVTRAAPFRVFDALEPYAPGDTAEGGVAAFYLCYFVPAEARAGEYTEELTIRVGGESARVSVRVRVYCATIPEAESLEVTNWFDLANMASRHDLAMWSEAHWEMIFQYGLMMRRARQTAFWVPLSLIDIQTTGEDQYAFDFSRAERLIHMYLDLGFSTIEGTHLCGRKSWTADKFHLNVLEEDIEASSARGYAFLAQYYVAWREFLEEHGWYELLIQHVADEPIEESADDYYRLAAITRQFLPGVPIIDAVEIPDLRGAIDIWVPKDDYYSRHMTEYETHRAAGNELWFYTCCIPGGKFLNRLLDKPLIEARYLHWGNFKYGLKGFLHWGFNMYRPWQDPFEENTPRHGETNRLPAGDTHIVYPGEGGPWSSMRLENQRAGAQDYELLTLLAVRNADLARDIADSVMRAFDDVELDPEAFERARKRVLDALG